MSVAEEDISTSLEGRVSGALDQEVGHPHCLLPTALAEIIRDIGLYLDKTCQLVRKPKILKFVNQFLVFH